MKIESIKTFQESIDNVIEGSVPSQPYSGPTTPGDSIQPMIEAMSLAHKCVLVWRIVEHYGLEVDDVEANAALVIATFGNMGFTFVEGSTDRYPACVARTLDLLRRTPLGPNHEIAAQFGNEEPWVLNCNRPLKATVRNCAHIAALTVRSILLRSSYSNIESGIEDSVARLQLDKRDQDAVLMWVKGVGDQRIKMGMRAARTRGEFIIMLSFAAVLGHSAFRKRVEVMYRKDVAEQYNNKIRSALMTDVAGSLVTGEMPPIYAGLIHLIRPVKRT